MKFIIWIVSVVAVSGLSVTAETREKSRDLPDPLKPWTGWALWNERDLDSPSPYNDSKKALRLWPSRLNLQVDAAGGRFGFHVAVFSETWVPLPGDAELWPVEVTANTAVSPVVEHDGRPSVKLMPGEYDLVGAYRWQGIPQKIAMPPEIGILALTLDGQPVGSPVWDAQGFLWLKRDASTEQADKDFLGIKAHSIMEDGIPLWLHTDLELIVAGKSREEVLGVALPEGWKLSSVDSPIPVAVDDAGQVKAQVRAGKWTVSMSAFRLDHPARVGYAAGAKPVAAEQLVAFRAQPDFRLVEIVGLPPIDVSQISFPDKWRQLPVYRWETATPFQIEERMRGMGLQKPEGLKIERELWLDQNGEGLTFRDHITGRMQQIWRLDAAEEQGLGSVRMRGEGQLITRNPQNNALGVEIRDRDLDMAATGRLARGRELSATGWRTDADGLSVTLNLPPGWRLFALFGADYVEGDWLTEWTLLDLFLLLIFTLAVFRMSGISVATLAFVAFGLSYHETGAPRYVWLVLLIPLALQRVVPKGWGQRVVMAGKWLAVLALVLVLVPFLGRQIQQCLYPQLENLGGHYPAAGMMANQMASPSYRMASDPFASESDVYLKKGKGASQEVQANDNLQYDTAARIQTGPGVPEWSWRSAHFGWNGPVTAAQKVRPVLIPEWLERSLSMARVLLLLGLAALLLGARRLRFSSSAKRGAPVMLVAALFFIAGSRAQAQLPDKEMLETLRARLTEASDAYPTAADIPHVGLTLRDRKITMDVEIHTATRTAVPLPGRLPEWSPVSVKVNGGSESTVCRDDGFLWIVLPAGVHHVMIEGLLADLTEWQWTYRLRPRRVTIDAPGWQVGGVRPGGIPEGQVFFTRIRKTTADEASYDHPNLQTAIGVNRQIEIGLVWQVRTVVSRFSPLGNAVSLRIPLLPGENVITSNAVVKEGFIEVRLGARQQEFVWQSELPAVSDLALTTRANDAWIERWSLVASPVWNVGISGLAPAFEAGNPQIVPVWKPWPGESTTLAISRPEAVIGATVTVARGTHEIVLGKRQRSSSLALSLRCSFGEDFLVQLPADADATSLTSDGTQIPIRKDGDKIMIPLKPGEQEVSLQWKSNTPLELLSRAEAVKLPVESANINSTIEVPDNRWVLWASGPQQGPAVRFWVILLGSLLAAWGLGRVPHSPLRPIEWMLLALGLTQVPLPLALVVVGWLFFLTWRGSDSFQNQRPLCYNFLQVVLVFLTMSTLGIFIAIVAEGLLGSPEMFISGNNSTRTLLRWYEARCDGALPQSQCFSISVWWYRLLMLLWALWLALSLIRWLAWGWRQFSAGALIRRKSKILNTPPPLP